MRVDWAGREASEGGHGAYEDCMPVAGKKKLKKTTIRTV